MRLVRLTSEFAAESGLPGWEVHVAVRHVVSVGPVREGDVAPEHHSFAVLTTDGNRLDVCRPTDAEARAAKVALLAELSLADDP